MLVDLPKELDEPFLVGLSDSEASVIDYILCIVQKINQLPYMNISQGEVDVCQRGLV